MDKRITVLDMIASDMKSDAEKFEGAVFNGRNVSKYLGNLGAAVASLAKIVKSVIEEKRDGCQKTSST